MSNGFKLFNNNKEYRDIGKVISLTRLAKKMGVSHSRIHKFMTSKKRIWLIKYNKRNYISVKNAKCLLHFFKADLSKPLEDLEKELDNFLS